MSSSSSSSSLSNLHSEIIKTHILPKLDGLSLLAVCSSSSDLRSDNELWKDICQSTWPSLNDPRISEAISTFPSGHRSFYNDSFPILHSSTHLAPDDVKTVPSELISVIEMRYQDKLVYSRVEVTKTNVHSFLSCALWIELSEPPKSTRLSGFSCSNSYEGEEECLAELEEKVTMNWIIIDPARKRAGNFSSVRPIFARRHWVTNEAHLRFVTILPAGKHPSDDQLVQCRIEVMCWGKKGGELQVREVIMMLHDMESRCLSGKESLVILQMAMEGGRRKLGDRGDEKVEYEEFLRMRRERMKRMKRLERRKAYRNRIFRLAVYAFCLSLFLRFLSLRIGK